jgi:integrase
VLALTVTALAKLAQMSHTWGGLIRCSEADLIKPWKQQVLRSPYQIRDLRAKAATDKEESTGNIREARDQLGHTTVTMTEQYIRNRKGKRVTSTK